MCENKSIEVTEEMTQAGIAALVSCISDAPRILRDDEIVSLIFSAMRGVELGYDVATKAVQSCQKRPI